MTASCQLPVLPGAELVEGTERPDKMAGAVESGVESNLRDGQFRGRQGRLGVIQPLVDQILCKRYAHEQFEEIAEVGLRHGGKFGHILNFQIFVKMFINVFQHILNQPLVFLVVLLRFARLLFRGIANTAQ